MIVKCPKCNAIVNYNFLQVHCGEKLPVPQGATAPTAPQEFPTNVRRQKKEKPKKTKHRKKIPKKLREKVLERDDYTCVRCHEPHEIVNVHHIIHRKHGGKDTLANLETLCEDCHMQEHESEPVYRIMKWRKEQREKA